MQLLRQLQQIAANRAARQHADTTRKETATMRNGACLPAAAARDDAAGRVDRVGKPSEVKVRARLFVYIYTQ